MWKSVELYIPLIFPIHTEVSFLELHTLSNLLEVLELARYLGNSARYLCNSLTVKELLGKQI